FPRVIPMVAHIAAHIVKELDGHRRPLSRLIPNFEALQSDPAAVLRDTPITIGSVHLLGTAIVVLGSYVVVCGCLSLLAFACADDFGRARQWSRPLLAIVQLTSLLGSFALLLGAGLFLYFKLLPNRKIVLHLDCVEFIEGRLALRCPWSLFCVQRVTRAR